MNETRSNLGHVSQTLWPCFVRKPDKTPSDLGKHGILPPGVDTSVDLLYIGVARGVERNQQTTKGRTMFRVFFALVNLGFAVWLISAFTGTETCTGLTGADLEACEAGTAIGGFAAAAMIVFLWLATDVILYVGRRIFARKAVR